MTTTNINWIRRRALKTTLVGAMLLAASGGWAVTELSAIEVWKKPTCGCCKSWITHLEKNGFKVLAHETGNTEMRQHLGMPQRHGSCHTALVKGYTIEGHVPAQEIRRLLREKPDAIGLAVPEMPIGSPGMDGPEYRDHSDPYDVLLVQKNGSTVIYQTYP